MHLVCCILVLVSGCGWTASQAVPTEIHDEMKTLKVIKSGLLVIEITFYKVS